MTMARSTVVRAGEAGVYHCVSRCVRRAFLCGRDPLTDQDFEHRRGWIATRLKELSEVFAVEILAYAVMSNHLHLVARMDPVAAQAWSSEEVGRRWCRLYPLYRDAEGHPVAPSAEAMETFLSGEGREAQCRERLGSLSWLMRCLSEPIARRANREDGCTGRFWEGRFKCQRLEDAGAVLACMTYVDLNPVRAQVAETPEQSDFTSVQDRHRAEAARRALAEVSKSPAEPGSEAQGWERQRLEAGAVRDAWLCPLGEERSEENLPSVDLSAYLALVDWTGRQIREDKAGSIPEELLPVLERLDLEVENWVGTVERYGGLYYRIAGRIDCLRRAALACGQRWFHGLRSSGGVYRRSAGKAA